MVGGKKTCQRTEGQGETSEPRHAVVCLGTEVGLTGVDDEGAGEYHLCQTEGGTLYQSQQHDEGEGGRRPPTVKEIP